MDAGLPVDPVLVLNVALLLPALILTDALLSRRRCLGYSASAPLLTLLGTLSFAIVSMIISMAMNDLAVSWAVAAVFTSTAVISFGLFLRFLTDVRGKTCLVDVLRRSELEYNAR